MKKAAKKKTPAKKTWHAEVIEVPRSPEDIIQREEEAEAAERAEGKKMLGVIRDGEKAYYQDERLQRNPHPVQTRLGIAWMFGWRRAQNTEDIRDLLHDLQSLQTWVEQEQRSGNQGHYNINVSLR